MKRVVLTGLLVLGFTCLFIVGSQLPVTAQGATPTPATPAPSGSLSPDEILAQANKASEDAAQAVNIVNTMLGFIQVAGVLGGLIAALGAGAFTLAGIRTIGEYRGEIDRAKEELGKMRDQLVAETEGGRQTINNYRAELDAARADLNRMRDQLIAEAENIRAQGNRSIQALSLMQLGEQPLESKNTKAALDIYQEAYNLDPSNRAINYFLGELNIQQNNLDAGIDLLERVLEGESEYAPAIAVLAYALRLQADKMPESNDRDQLYAESEARFLKALKIDPKVRDIYGESIYGVLGGLYKRQGRVDDAIRCYKEAEQITPHRSYPVVNLATLYFLTGKKDLAERYFRRSLTLAMRALDNNPFDYWTRFDLTMNMLVLGNIEEALQNLDIAIQQVQSPHPLEVFLSDLQRMKEAPYPPANVDQVIQRVQEAIKRLTPA